MVAETVLKLDTPRMFFQRPDNMFVLFRSRKAVSLARFLSEQASWSSGAKAKSSRRSLETLRGQGLFHIKQFKGEKPLDFLGACKP